MSKKLQLIRGQRILNQMLEDLDETAFTVLRANAKKIPAGDREADAVPIRVQKLILTPFEQTGQLQVEGETNSDGNVYRTTIMFQEVEYQESNEASNVTFTGSDGNTYNITPIQLSRINVKVSCECLDFYWRFAKYNATDGSLQGNPPQPYQKKTARAPANPQRVPGVCKHLLATMVELRQSGIATN
jgi:hypothetical protein